MGASVPTSSYYMVRSSVLGGGVVTRLDSSGGKAITYVPAGGLVEARQGVSNGQQSVSWTFKDPVGATEQGPGGLAAYDPLGNYVSYAAPQGPPPQAQMPGYYGAWSALSNAYNLPTGCILDGRPADCNKVGRDLNNRAATRDANHILGWTETQTLAGGSGGGYAGWVDEWEDCSKPGVDAVCARNVGGFVGGTEAGSQNPRGPVVDSSDLGPPPPFVQPPPNVAGIRAELERMLKDPKCSGFIEDLLRRVSNKHKENPLVKGGDIIQIFNLINSSEQAGMIRSGAPGSYVDSQGRGGNYALGSIGGHNARIQLAPTYGRITTAKDDAFQALHETIHHAGENVYTDQVLAEAIQEKTGIEIRGADGSPLTGDPKKDIYRYSNYWNLELKDHCK